MHSFVYTAQLPLGFAGLINECSGWKDPSWELDIKAGRSLWIATSGPNLIFLWMHLSPPPPLYPLRPHFHHPSLGKFSLWYRIAIRKLASFHLAVAKADRQTAKFNSPPKFPAIYTGFLELYNLKRSYILPEINNMHRIINCLFFWRVKSDILGSQVLFSMYTVEVLGRGNQPMGFEIRVLPTL